jgi:hypothetical protein
MEFRQACCDFMLHEQPDFFSEFLDEEKLDNYIERMREVGTWGSQMEIVGLCRAYKVDCVIFRPDGLHYRIECGSDEPSKILMISHHDDEHFNVVKIRRKSEVCIDSFEELDSILATGGSNRPTKRETRLAKRKGDPIPSPQLQKLVNI